MATLSPLPWLLLIGAEFVTMPFLFERLKRRLEIEKKHAERQVQTLSQEEQFEQLAPEAKIRFGVVRRLCQQIQGNYKAFSPASQAIVAEQTGKFDAILASCLRRLWLVQKYEAMARTLDHGRVRAEITRLEDSLKPKDVPPRVREAWEQNLELKRKLVETVERNTANRMALLAELDSLESLLQLLLQKSVAATDPEAFSAEVDDIVAQVEADAASVQEMEALMGAMPELVAAPTLSEKLKAPIVPFPSSPPPPPPPRRRERG